MGGATGGTTGGAIGWAAARAQPVHAGDRRCGGRFWALADPEEDGADGEADEPPSPPSPTPSDHVNDWFNASYSEEEVASAIDDILPIHDPARLGLEAGEKRELVRRIVHWRTLSAANKPWKGPLPKVNRPNLTVFDLIKPDSWVVVKRKKVPRRTMAGSRPAATELDTYYSGSQDR